VAGRSGIAVRLFFVVAQQHPEISLGRGQRNRVPVDEHMALTDPHHVAAVRFPMGDHPVGAAPRYVKREAVAQRQQFGHIARVWCEQFPRRLGERPTRPGLVQLS